MITLINPPGIKSFSGLQMHTPNPPIGLAYISAALKAEGLPVTIIDATGEALDEINPHPDREDFLVQGLPPNEIICRIPDGTDIVGLSCMFSTLWPISRELAAGIRDRFPDVTIVLGGEHGTAVYENVLRTSEVDIVVLGEGELTVIELVEAIRCGTDLQDVTGIAYRANGDILSTGLSDRNRSVDEIAEPDWGAFPLEAYISRHQMNGVNLGRSIPLLATRGCPYQCTFCSNPNMWTQRWISRDPIKVADEMEKYVRDFNVTNFDFQDLTAIVNRRWVIEFCNEVIGRGLKITWQMPSGTRAEIFDDEVAELLMKSGCSALAFAPESGSENMLHAVKKQVDLARMEDSIKTALNYNLKLSCFFVIGFPGETKRTLSETLKYIRHIALMGVYDISVTKFVPYPGSELFLQLQREGIIELDDKFFVSPMDFYSSNAPSYAEDISNRRLYYSMIWMYLNFYIISFGLRPFRMFKILYQAVFTGIEQTRYAKWFMDMFFVRRQWRQQSKSNG